MIYVKLAVFSNYQAKIQKLLSILLHTCENMHENFGTQTLKKTLK